MPKKLIHKEDYIRSIVTDTSPFDTPMIFSNDGFYLNLTSSKSEKFNEIVKKLIFHNNEATRPFQYSIRKDNESTRKLSLVHPSSQYRMAKFYEEYSDLICYYTTKSQCSLRYPKRISSTFFKSGVNNNGNELKSDDVEGVVHDLVNKHSISFFAYGGYSRIYKFLSSNEFMRLERKYGELDLLDVSNCFGSIYSHSLPWATKSKEHVKDNLGVKATFGQSFDKLMQEANYNETNGIVVGPEVSRVFSEIIFQKIDNNCIGYLSKNHGMLYGFDYEIKRYIDDVFIFSKDKDVSKLVFNRYVDELMKYNLHVNDNKTKSYSRPFLTDRSQLVIIINEEINSFSKSFYERRNDAGIELNTIYNYIKLSNKFINKVKSICISRGCGYDDVTPYIISSLENISKNVISLGKSKLLSDEDCVSLKNIFRTIINVSFHFYTVSPSVSSSYVLSRMCLTVAKFFEFYNADYEDTIKQYMFDCTNSFFESGVEYNRIDREGLLPLEVLNLILFTSELGYEYKIPEKKLMCLFSMDESFNTYFQLVSALYYMKGYHFYKSARKQTINAIDKVVSDCKIFKNLSGPTHTILDSLSCPYIDKKKKAKWVKELCKQLSITCTKEEEQALVSEFEGCYWFINWNDFNLANMLEKKLLKTNY